MTPEIAATMDRDTVWSLLHVHRRRARSHGRLVRRLERNLWEERELAATFESEYLRFLEAVAASGAHPYVAKAWGRHRPRQLSFDFGGGA